MLKVGRGLLSRVSSKAPTVALLLAIFCASGLAAFWWNSHTLGIFPSDREGVEDSEPAESLSEPEPDVVSEPEEEPEPEPVVQVMMTQPVGEPEATTVDYLVKPVAGEEHVGYGWTFSTTHDDWRFHAGLDYKVPVGTPVRAAAQGTVERVSEDLAWGVQVVLRHEGDLETRYMGLTEVTLTPGDKVEVGQVIAQVGEPGLSEVADGPHLHFEVRRSGEPVDPMSLFR